LTTEYRDIVLRFVKVPKWKRKYQFHKSKTFMDYLHGDVKGEEAWLAFRYEYLRELEVVWKAAQHRHKRLKPGLRTGAFRAPRDHRISTATGVLRLG